MKKLIAVLAAVLCLAGCSAQEEMTEMVGVTVVTESETAETPAQQEAETVPPQHVEITIEEVPTDTAEEGEAVSPAGVPSMPEVELLEGLVGDSVGYSLEIPVFDAYAAAETMNGFYVDLVDGLERYCQNTVNTACLERNCVASVFGKVTSAILVGEELQVGYECRVEYSDTEEPVINSRMDVWNVENGEVTSEVK